VQCNRLLLDCLAEFEGVGMYYAVAQACGTGPVAIVGGGNSAGQAALFLSRTFTAVHVIIRGDSLDTSSSTDRAQPRQARREHQRAGCDQRRGAGSDAADSAGEVTANARGRSLSRP
jgi:thioredoxin reductase